jgi:hypothetical protein
MVMTNDTANLAAAPISPGRRFGRKLTEEHPAVIRYGGILA